MELLNKLKLSSGILKSPLLFNTVQNRGFQCSAVHYRKPWSHYKHGSRTTYKAVYQRPIYRQKDLEALEENLEEKEKLSHLPFYPPFPWMNDSVWHDPLIHRFSNHFMLGGNRVMSKHIMEKTFECIKRIQLAKWHETTDEVERSKIVLDPQEVFRIAIDNVRPTLETITVKKGGANYQVPVGIVPNRTYFLAIKYIKDACARGSKPPEVSFWTKLASEIMDAYNNTGKCVKRKNELHKLCEANRAYAHFRWA